VQLGDLFRRLHAIIRFADDFDIGMRAEQLLQPLARRLLVVDHQRADHRAFTTSTVTSS
jgi:hypothetical protein